MSQLENISKAIQESSKNRRLNEKEWFENNKPILEFSLKNADDDIETHYDVWNWDED